MRLLYGKEFFSRFLLSITAVLGKMNFSEWLVLLRETLRLDVYDLGYAYSSEALNVLAWPPEALTRYTGSFWRIGVFLWRLIKSLFVYRYTRYRTVPQNSCVFCFSTLNQKLALRSLAEKSESAELVGLDLDVNSVAMEDVRHFPVAWVYIFSLPFFPLILYRFFKARGYCKRSYRIGLDQYWLTYGHYITCRLWLRCVSPSVVVVSNDHLTHTRTLVAAAKAVGIPTIYVQHASVTAQFPPLVFDYALLEGRDALTKYDRVSSDSKVFLIGMPKADSYHPYINTRTHVKSVGICTNALVSVSCVKTLLELLTQHCTECAFTLRPHPRDANREGGIWQKLAAQYNVRYSDGRTEFAFDFLKEVDAIIAGDSSILLEAALLNVVPLYYDFSGEKQLDHYGYVQNGLAEYHGQPSDLVRSLNQMVQSKPYVRRQAKLYCATVDTSFDGHSAELGADLIRKIAYDQGVDLTIWQRIADVGLTAYKLCEQI